MGKVRAKHYGAVKHCVFGDCVSDNRIDTPGYNPQVRFFCFPKPCLEVRKLNIKDEQIRSEHLRHCKYCEGVEMWVKSCKSKKLTSMDKITWNTYICDKHFLRKYNSIKDIDHRSIAPKSSVIINIMKRREVQEKAVRDNFVTDPHDDLSQHPSTKLANTVHFSMQTDKISTQDASCQTDFDLGHDSSGLQINNQVQKGWEIKKFEEKLKSNSKMCQFYTGMEYSTIQTVLSFLCIEEGITSIKYCGSKVAQVKRKPKQWSFMQELILTLVILRTGLLVEDIAYRFDVCPSYVSEIVTTWIQLLYQKFTDIKPFMLPPRDVIQETLPACFANMTNIRVIIDGTEIFCQTPSDYQQQGNLYSHYKSHTTCKLLIGCTPQGGVAFVSELFEGSISDRDLVIKSHLLELLQENDLVLADRGFTIKDLLDEKKASINIPAFLMGRERHTAQEEVETKVIAKQRLYVEHVIGRLKKYRLLKKVIPLSMRGIISQMVFVCACLLNFQEPYIT